jgi:hypothetical protein
MNGPVSVAIACEAVVVLIIFMGAAIIANWSAIIATIQSWAGA